MHKDFPLEEAYLNHAKAIARQHITDLQQAAEKEKETILQQKQEMREEAKHAIGGSLWSGDGFEQLVAMSQFATQASDTIARYENDVKKIGQLEQFLENPYFARIDFRFDDEDELEKVYIGRFSLLDDQKYQMIVYDWRSPISSMFYRFGTGKAFYEAPAGNITGEICLKRQYEIEQGHLTAFFDTDIQILDEFLRKMLTQNATPQMKSIVETIQRDQDLIIRNMESDLLMVQGVAGSGKTSVALHRVAYLMYHGLTHRLNSQNIVIISPNALFEEYIANVLPELGEENIASLLLEELIRKLVKKRVQSRAQLYEGLMTNEEKPWVRQMKRSLSFKLGRPFIEILNRVTLPRKLSAKEALALYRGLFADEGQIARLAQGAPLPEDWPVLCSFTLESLDSKQLAYDDAAAVAYLYLKSNRFDQYKHIKQVVVDEAQDYYPLHFELLAMLFPNAQFTILGDRNQTIEKQETMAFYDEIERSLNKKRATLVTMNKSFRCAHEILEFSARFIDAQIQSFSRHCEVPQVYKTAGEKDVQALLAELSLCQAQGYQSVGILCKSAKDAQALHRLIKDKAAVTLIKSQTGCDLQGTFLLPIYLSKGLEFDAALLWGTDNQRYNTAEDRQLLYIGCTRALHRLGLFYWGAPNPWCVDTP